MVRLVVWLLLTGVAITLAPVGAADPPKDTPSAAFTRTKKLKGKVTVDFKNEFLKAAFEEMSSQLEDQKLGPITVHYGVGVSQNTRITYSGKNVTAEEALDGILKQLDLGYSVVSKDKDRYDGWIEVSKGNHRGYPAGVTAPKTDPKADPKTDPKSEPKTETKPDPKTETKPDPKTDPKPKVDLEKPAPKTTASDDPDEKQARSRLDLAKECIEGGKKEDAARLLKFILRNYPKTQAAEEAKKLAETIK